MTKTETVGVRIQPELKNRAEDVFRRLGLTATQAIIMFYKQVELRNGLPFEVVIPNETTYKTFENTDAEHDLIVCEKADDMFRKPWV